MGSKLSRKLVCPTCHAETCFKCAKPYHRCVSVIVGVRICFCGGSDQIRLVGCEIALALWTWVGSVLVQADGLYFKMRGSTWCLCMCVRICVSSWVPVMLSFAEDIVAKCFEGASHSFATYSTCTVQTRRNAEFLLKTRHRFSFLFADRKSTTALNKTALLSDQSRNFRQL